MIGEGGPTVRRLISQGQSLTFFNEDAPRQIEHTITACKAPCNRTTGIASARGCRRGVRLRPARLRARGAAAQRDTWQTPRNLKPGTYTLLLPRAPVHARIVPGEVVRRRGILRAVVLPAALLALLVTRRERGPVLRKDDDQDALHPLPLPAGPQSSRGRTHRLRARASKPSARGWIVYITTSQARPVGQERRRSRRVDVIHLHHAVLAHQRRRHLRGRVRGRPSPAPPRATGGGTSRPTRGCSTT